MDENLIPKPHQLVQFTADSNDGFNDFIAGYVNCFFDIGSQPSKGTKQKINQNKLIKLQMESFLGKLKAGETIDIVSDSLPCNYKAVNTLEAEYLNDPMMSDLVEGQFNVLGKVIRVIEKSEDNSISLIRKTSLSMMPEHVLESMISSIQQLSIKEGFKIPPLEWELKGPVMQLIPVAIFA